MATKKRRRTPRHGLGKIGSNSSQTLCRMCGTAPCFCPSPPPEPSVPPASGGTPRPGPDKPVEEPHK